MVSSSSLEIDLEEESFTDQLYKIGWLEEGIVLLQLTQKDIMLDLETTVKMHEDILDMVGGEPFRIITDARNAFGNFTKESREYSANHEEFDKLRIRSAVIVNSLPMKIMVNAYLRAMAKGDRLKSFSTVESAMKWLKEEV